MNLNKKSLGLTGLLAAVLALTSCKKEQLVDTSVAADRNVKIVASEVKFGEVDDDFYENNLDEFYQLLLEAEDASVSDVNERYVRMAKAEAALLDSAVMLPATTRGGNYALTRIAPRTVAYTYNGNDDDRLKNLVMTEGGADSIIKRSDREALLEQWEKAKNGSGKYDPAAYLKKQGYKIGTKYTGSFSAKPSTLDILATSQQTDSESMVNTTQGLVEYDNFGNAKATGSKNWTVSGDGKTYTFYVPKGNKWVNHEGNVTSYGNVTAQDYVDGFHHMLDAKGGLEWLVDGVINKVHEYLTEEETDFSKVGFRADGEDKIVVELVKPEPFFPTRLAYSMFSPLKKEFYESKGGVFGVSNYKEKSASSDYTYGQVNKPENMIYCGAFYLANHTASDNSGEILMKRNKKYFNDSKTTLEELKWVYDGGENPEQTWNTFKDGTYSGLGLSAANGNLQRAKDAGLFDDHHYIADTESVSYLASLNLHRQTFEKGSVKSKKTTELQEFWQKAIQSKNVRKAILYGFNKASYNATNVGEEIKLYSLRNMYTKPDFVVLSADVEFEGHTFPKGSKYGDVCQYFCNQLGLGIDVNDAVEGWYSKEAAQKLLEQGKKDLKAAGVEWNDAATVEWVYYSASVAQTAIANTWANDFTSIFEGQGLKADLIATDNTDDFYSVGYKTKAGSQLGSDIFAGSGWGPDYADPSTYLDTFKPAGDGYMSKILGLY